MVNSANTENTSCALCNSSEQDKAYNNFTSPYAVVRCQSCGFYYLSPRLTEAASLEIYKNDNYFESDEGGYSSYIEQEKALRATFHRFMINLQKHNLTGGSLLEVGCGFGYLLEQAKDFFKDRVGIDFSHRACELAKGNAERIYEGGIDNIPPSDKFDCIIAVNVIEHVYQPQKFLEKLCRHLNPEGKIIVATPDIGSFWRRMMGHSWPSFKIPEHILYFDKKSLFTFLKQVGLTSIQTLPFPHAFPLPLIASKLKIKLPAIFDKIIFWLPSVMIAMYGVYSDEDIAGE